jgi:hypothetical protein
MLGLVALVKSDILEKLVPSIIRVTRFIVLWTTLAVTNICRTLWGNTTCYIYFDNIFAPMFAMQSIILYLSPLICLHIFKNVLIFYCTHFLNNFHLYCFVTWNLVYISGSKVFPFPCIFFFLVYSCLFCHSSKRNFHCRFVTSDSLSRTFCWGGKYANIDTISETRSIFYPCLRSISPFGHLSLWLPSLSWPIRMRFTNWISVAAKAMKSILFI